jgi:solute carrier family 25 protein 33/36
MTVKTIHLSTVEYLTIASIAKLIASMATYPHEVVRTRMREQKGRSGHKYTGFVQALQLIAKEEGIRGLYGGMAAHLIRVVPNAAIMFMTYETVVKMLS